MSVDIDKLKEAGIVSIRDFLLEKKKKGETALRLESGDPSFEPPVAVRMAMNKAIQDGKTHYTPAAGITDLREACFKKLKEVNKHQNITSKDDILITNGAMHGLYLAINAVVEDCRIADYPANVYIPKPVWTEIDTISLEAGAAVHYYDINPFNQEDKMEQIRSIFKNESVDVFVLNTPHNPTGVMFTPEEVKEIVELCVGTDVYLISDEAYEHITYEGGHVSPAHFCDQESDNVISVYSTSKSYAMSGLRIGYVATNATHLMKRMKEYARFTINGTCSIAQWGAVEAIGNEDPFAMQKMLKEYKERRDILFEGLQKCKGLTPYKPKGAFYIWAKINKDAMNKGKWKGVKSEGWQVAKKLLEEGIGVAPGEVFGPKQDQYLRFSFSCSTEHVKRAAEILSKL